MSLRIRLALIPYAAVLLSSQARAQSQLAGSGGNGLHMMNTDLTVLEAQDVRKDLPCSVTPVKPVLGFDLREFEARDAGQAFLSRVTPTFPVATQRSNAAFHRQD